MSFDHVPVIEAKSDCGFGCGSLGVELDFGEGTDAAVF